MSTGRVNINLDQTAVNEVLDLLMQIEQRMPFLLRLSNDEKLRLVKPHPGTRVVVEEIARLGAETGIITAQDDPMMHDLSVYDGLRTVGDRVSDLLQRIEDTRLQAGSESWSTCLVRYAMLRQLERNQPALKAKLDHVQPLITSRSRRSQQARPDETDETTEANEPTEPTEATEPCEDTVTE